MTCYKLVFVTVAFAFSAKNHDNVELQLQADGTMPPLPDATEEAITRVSSSDEPSGAGQEEAHFSLSEDAGNPGAVAVAVRRNREKARWAHISNFRILEFG